VHRLLLPRFGTPLANVAAPNDLRRAHLPALRALAAAASVAAEEAADEAVLASPGIRRPVVHAGFHAIPSLPPLHLHVISSDFDSPAVKTKKHVASFLPHGGFFLPLSEVIALLREAPDDGGGGGGGGGLGINRAVAEEKLKEDPETCPRCGRELDEIAGSGRGGSFSLPAFLAHVRRCEPEEEAPVR
jgi:hypothetical protein